MYATRNLSVLCYANGFTFWHYQTDDTSDEVRASGYFNEASDMMARGDVILATTRDAVEQMAVSHSVKNLNHTQPGRVITAPMVMAVLNEHAEAAAE